MVSTWPHNSIEFEPYELWRGSSIGGLRPSYASYHIHEYRAVSNVKYELGMFLWVRLIIDTLSQATVLQEFEEAVENLPEGLDQA